MKFSGVERWKGRGAAILFMVGLLGFQAAEVQAQQSPGFDIQTFQPAVGPGGIFGVEGAETHGHLQPYGSVYFDYMNQPLVLGFEDGTRRPVIEHRLAGHLRAGLGLWDVVQLDVGLPILLLNDGRYGEREIGGSALGRMSAGAQAMILSSREAPIGLAAGVRLGFGGNEAAFAGGSGLSLAGQLIADRRFSTPVGEVFVAANLGVGMGRSERFHDAELGTAMSYGAGVEVEVIDGLMRVGGELIGSFVVAEPSVETSPLEGLLGVSFLVTRGLEVKAGAGSGLVAGVGSPRVRGFAGVVYQAPVGRGLQPVVTPTVEVDCPEAPEGFRGRYDEAGCPIVEEGFRGCANLVANWDGLVDQWGCPILDGDGDGVLHGDDRCPDDPMVFIDGASLDGCPDDDVDNDGIDNVHDLCPTVSGVRAYQGCPPAEEEEKAVRGVEEIEISENVYFVSDRALIREESYGLLEEVAWVMRKNDDILLVEIAGHTDQRGDAEYNRMLSEERAKAVREFLIKEGGIRESRLRAQGYGMSELLEEGDTEEAHARNRRVEFRIIEQGTDGVGVEQRGE